MSHDWQKGSGFVKEPKVTKDVGKNKDGYGDAETIEATNPQSLKPYRQCAEVMKKEINLVHHFRVITKDSPCKDNYGRRNNDKNDFVLKIILPGF